MLKHQATERHIYAIFLSCTHASNSSIKKLSTKYPEWPKAEKIKFLFCKVKQVGWNSFRIKKVGSSASCFQAELFSHHQMTWKVLSVTLKRQQWTPIIVLKEKEAISETPFMQGKVKCLYTLHGWRILDGLFWIFMGSPEALMPDWPEEPENDSEITSGMGFGENQTPI